MSVFFVALRTLAILVFLNLAEPASYEVPRNGSLTMKYNPFRPGSVVTPGMFAGRGEEIDSIEQALLQTRHGNPQHFIIEGERGIGKSSLCLWVDSIARGNSTYDGTNRLSFISVNVELHESMAYDDIVDTLIIELRREVSSRATLIESCKKAWEFLSRFQAAGIKYDRPQPKPTDNRRLDELTDVIVNVINESAGAVEGIALLIDEADRPPASSNLGQLCKLLTERLARRGCENVCIGLAGLPALLGKLKDSHESSLRIFNIMHLAPLEPHERDWVIEKGIEDANKKNQVQTTIEADAKRAISNLSEGYPHFLQEFAHCSFAKDSDNNISVDDVFDGMFSEHGALNQLGRKYFTDVFIDQIASEDYRRVLIAMSAHMDKWVGRQKIIEQSGVKERTVDNALAALKDRNIILSNARSRGEYRLPTRSFAVWIRVKETTQVGGEIRSLPSPSDAKER